MTNHYTPSKAVAILAGTAATGGALAILLSDAVTIGHYGLEHLIMPIVVGITILSGHLIGSAVRSFKPLSAVGFAILFALGTALTIYSGIGRQSERTDTKAAVVEQSNTAIRDKQADLAKARLRKEQAEAMADKERGSECGRKCKDWTLRSKEVAANIEKIERELAGLGAVKPVNPKAQKAAEIAALFGADPVKVQHGIELVEPCAYSLLLELTAIVAFGFAFGGGHTRPAHPVMVQPIPLVPVQTPVKALMALESPVVVALRNADRPLSNGELAAAMRCSAGQASKLRREVAGLVREERDGKTLRLSLH